MLFLNTFYMIKIFIEQCFSICIYNYDQQCFQIIIMVIDLFDMIGWLNKRSSQHLYIINFHYHVRGISIILCRKYTVFIRQPKFGPPNTSIVMKFDVQGYFDDPLDVANFRNPSCTRFWFPWQRFFPHFGQKRLNNIY